MNTAASHKLNSIFWFRKDLRLFDNPGLWTAVRDSDHVVCLYIYEESSTGNPWPIGSAQKWWLYHSLKSLSDSLANTVEGHPKKMCLLIKKGDPSKIIPNLFHQSAEDQSLNFHALYMNKVYEPFHVASDAKLIENLKKAGVRCFSFNASLLLEPTVILNQSGTYFKVFTPYWRRCMEVLLELQTGPTPRKLFDRPTFNTRDVSRLQDRAKRLIEDGGGGTDDILDSLSLLPTTHHDWSIKFKNTWVPGEEAAHRRMREFVNDHLDGYEVSRDKLSLVDGFGTSRLSPRLALGELGPWQIWHSLFPRPTLNLNHLKQRGGKDRYLAELGWREFSYYLLHHFPQFPTRNFRSEFDRFQWVSTTGEDDQKHLKAWQKGETGYPVVDAGMKQLWYEGYMHNRARMITASFLTKDLLIDWRIGSLWFWDTLVDADLANNSSGWQWVAGTGADASPYFRIFNPILQGEKFDPEGKYVKKWLPALANVPLKYVHTPWKCPKNILQKCGFTLGVDYPEPIVEHEKCRARALNYFKILKDTIPPHLQEKVLNTSEASEANETFQKAKKKQGQHVKTPIASIEKTLKDNERTTRSNKKR